VETSLQTGRGLGVRSGAYILEGSCGVIDLTGAACLVDNGIDLDKVEANLAMSGESVF